MYTNQYFVDKVTGTYSDALVAFGLAYLLERALQDAALPSKVTIRDYGTTYLLQLDTAMTREIVKQATYPAEMLRIIKNEQEIDGPPIYPLGDYYKIMSSRTAASAGKADAEQAAQLEIPDEQNVFGLIEQLQGDGVLERLAIRLWQYRAQYSTFLELVLCGYAQNPNNLGLSYERFIKWKKDNDVKDFANEDSMLAIFNPTYQKSINRAKPDGAENKNQNGFWLPEWLKMIGMPRCSLVVSVRAGKNKQSDEDKKVYVVAPTSIPLSSHNDVMKEFRKGIYRYSSVRADITVLFSYIESLLLYIQRDASTTLRVRRNARTAVNGFYSAYFKKSSSQRSAFSLTNLPHLQLPLWITFEGDNATETELSCYQGIIKHQRDVLFYRYNENGQFKDFIDENQSEGFQLLRDYRDFISGGDTATLLSFYADFAALIMQQGAQKKGYRQFDLSEIRRLFLMLNPTLQETIDDEGFREVARAIRLATVTAQRLKAKGVKVKHEIRYGLAQELKRKAPFKSEFTQAIMEFINQYQTENARYRERGGSNIHEVTTTHVRHLAALIDACPSNSAEPVASLLLAFGYAFDDTRSEQEDEDVSIDTAPKNIQEVSR